LSTADADRDLALDGLRGLAALAVVIHHFTGRPGLFHDPQVAGYGALGALGVDVFFVISGYLIPSLLLRRPTGTRPAARFVLRRLVRLLPPYWLAMLLSVASLALVGHAVQTDAAAWACHITQSCGSLKITWWNGVFWSLPVEIQFYVIAALLVPIAMTLPHWGRWLLALALLLSALKSPDSLAFQYAPQFLAGVAALAWRQGALKAAPALLCALAIAAAHAVAFNGFAPIVYGLMLFTAWVIVAQPRTLKPFAGLGAISYSLYLIHVPIGYRVVEWGLAATPQAPLAVRLGWFTLALALSIVAAIGFYWLIEKPSIAWSKRVKR
jgi:peptidoglycan/LPS O-acetylase OafA/YrhL